MESLPIKAQRLSYPALICQDLENTLEFYRGVLGMEPIAWHQGSDDVSFTHLFLDAGGGAVLEFVGPSQPGRTVLAKGRLGVGSLQRLTLQLDTE
ncbi:MAG: VOC family protein, partial [Chloroflexi bacterium]|nr:VOC family protein [Chloroflexota bacterium]